MGSPRQRQRLPVQQQLVQKMLGYTFLPALCPSGKLADHQRRAGEGWPGNADSTLLTGRCNGRIGVVSKAVQARHSLAGGNAAAALEL